LQHLAAASSRLSFYTKHIFNGDGQAGEQADRFAPLTFRVHAARLLQRIRLIDMKKGADMGFALLNGLEELVGQCLGGYLALGERGQQIGGAALNHASVSSTAGTA